MRVCIKIPDCSWELLLETPARVERTLFLPSSRSFLGEMALSLWQNHSDKLCNHIIIQCCLIKIYPTVILLMNASSSITTSLFIKRSFLCRRHIGPLSYASVSSESAVTSVDTVSCQ